MFNRDSRRASVIDADLAVTTTDAPSIPVHAGDTEPGAGPMEWLSGSLDRATIAGQLYDVIDPEVGVNIVDLGLLYGLAAPDGKVRIEMTLTTPGCPLGGYIEDEIHRALWGVPGIEDINVDIVWEPPWGPELMSDAAKRDLGWI